MMTLHFLNDVANDAVSTKKSKLRLESETRGKLLNRLPGSHLLIYQVYQTPLLECMLNGSANPVMSTSILKALPGKLDIKRHSPSILYQLVYITGTCDKVIFAQSWQDLHF